MSKSKNKMMNPMCDLLSIAVDRELPGCTHDQKVQNIVKQKYRKIKGTFPRILKYQKDGADYWLVDARSKRWGLDLRKSFNSEKQSRDYVRELETQLSERGKDVSTNVVYQNKHIEKMVERLNMFGKSLDDCVDFFVKHLECEIKQSIIPPVRDLCPIWFDEKTKNHLEPVSNRTRIEYKSFSKYIVNVLGSLKPTDVTKKTIQELLNNVHGEQLTKKKYLQYLKNFFNWCIENDHVKENPVKGVNVKIKRKEVVIFNEEETEKLLRLCQSKFPSMLGYYCLCVFGGLRPSESQRVQWEDLNFDGEEVFVTDKSKTGIRRFILKDTKTLWVWLNHIRTTRPDHPLNPTENHSNLQKKIRKELGIKWNQDVLRHSFGTYYYNLTKDLNQVSHDMGNSVQVCRKHYVRHVSKSSTDKFWGLQP